MLSFAKSLLNLRMATLMVCTSLLFACQSTPKQEPVAELAPPPAPTPAPVHLQQKAIDFLLSEADWALSQGKLLNPINDNAHDRYRSVLLMDPKNEHALLGLQTIAKRYLDQAHDAARKGRMNDAQIMIKYARTIDDSEEVQQAAESMRKQVANIEPPKPFKVGDGETVLDPKMIKSKDPQITTQLVGVAQKAKQNDEFVLIVAGTDADGRWIYQQLRNAVPGYLVRGDIRIGQPARVKLVKSLD